MLAVFLREIQPQFAGLGHAQPRILSAHLFVSVTKEHRESSPSTNLTQASRLATSHLGKAPSWLRTSFIRGVRPCQPIVTSGQLGIYGADDGHSGPCLG